MRKLLALATVILTLSTAVGQTDDQLSVTLPSGKVLHFDSTEAKAKFFAARSRQQAQTLTQPSPAGPSTGRPSIGMHATPKKGSASYTTDDFGIGVNFQQMVGLDVELKNYALQPIDLEAFCIFFGRRLSDNTRFIVGIVRRDVPLAGGAATSIEFKSPKIQQVDYSRLQSARYEGWLVELHQHGVNGPALAYSGSTSFLEDLGPKQELTDMVEEFEKAHARE